AQAGDVVELLDEAREVTDAVAVGVLERAHVELVDGGVLVPEGVSLDVGGCRSAGRPANAARARRAAQQYFPVRSRGLFSRGFEGGRPRCPGALLRHGSA